MTISPPVVPAQAGTLRMIVRDIARGGIAGLLSGIAVAGIGSRLAMRISAQIDRPAHGLKTEAGATIGEFTLEGTMEVIVFVGLFTGIVIAFIWVIVQRWLPAGGRARYVAAAAVAVAMGGRFAIDGTNFDFRILDPALAHIAVFVTLAGLTGLAVVAIDGWLDDRLPAPDGAPWAVYVAIAWIGAPFAFPLAQSYFSAGECGCRNRPWVVGALFVAVGVVTIVGWVIRARGGTEPVAVRRTGVVMVLAMTVAGVAHLGGEIARFV